MMWIFPTNLSRWINCVFFLTVISLSSIYNQLDILLTIDIQLNKNIWALAVTFGQVCYWMTLISDGYMRETRRFINIGF